jgi:hypothetical protein
MKRRYQRSLSIPAIRKFREAIESGNIGKWLIESGENTNAGSVKVKYTLKDKPWIVEVIARRNYYGFRRN